MGIGSQDDHSKSPADSQSQSHLQSRLCSLTADALRDDDSHKASMIDLWKKSLFTDNSNNSNSNSNSNNNARKEDPYAHHYHAPYGHSPVVQRRRHSSTSPPLSERSALLMGHYNNNSSQNLSHNQSKNWWESLSPWMNTRRRHEEGSDRSSESSSSDPYSPMGYRRFYHPRRFYQPLPLLWVGHSKYVPAHPLRYNGYNGYGYGYNGYGYDGCYGCRRCPLTCLLCVVYPLHFVSMWMYDLWICGNVWTSSIGCLWNGWIGPSPRTLSAFGTLNPAKILYRAEYWRFVTSNFVSCNLLHFTLHLWALWLGGTTTTTTSTATTTTTTSTAGGLGRFEAQHGTPTTIWIVTGTMAVVPVLTAALRSQETSSHGSVLLLALLAAQPLQCSTLIPIVSLWILGILCPMIGGTTQALAIAYGRLLGYTCGCWQFYTTDTQTLHQRQQQQRQQQRQRLPHISTTHSCVSTNTHDKLSSHSNHNHNYNNNHNYTSSPFSNLTHCIKSMATFFLLIPTPLLLGTAYIGLFSNITNTNANTNTNWTTTINTNHADLYYYPPIPTHILPNALPVLRYHLPPTRLLDPTTTNCLVMYSIPSKNNNQNNNNNDDNVNNNLCEDACVPYAAVRSVLDTHTLKQGSCMDQNYCYQNTTISTTTTTTTTSTTTTSTLQDQDSYWNTEYKPKVNTYTLCD